ncbi:MAG: N-acetylglucosaminyltransferase (EC [uncultured Aureispira sp.]|uniref:N-acetylglucosaminyltransferase (EC) n=1 Tax=uncultured Aureispira sp. TaxID=1331704 RepID=A0A6S6S666_9BACT|nr:MAG: N-acetylglucosaminyltransferase (EC [uncultured Aureispira sp.]
MFTIYSIFSIALTLCYLFIILIYIFYWNLLEQWDIPSNNSFQTKVSLIIAARNEADNIKACLEAVLAQTYPTALLEILVVNDHSEDETVTIVNSFPEKHLHLLHLPEDKTGKKQAIQLAINQATGTLIVTTDADCVMEKDWLKYIVSYYEAYQPKLIAAPVSFHQENSIFERFQTLDFMGMMAVSGAGIKGRFMNMSNGANLTYERAAFDAVRGFEGIDHLASGDDMLLMQKIAKKYPKGLAYLKNRQAQTLTQAKPSVKTFLQQRIRWASKSSAYTNWQTLAILVLVWVFCLSMLVDLLLIPYDYLFLFWFLFKFIVKGFADFFFLGMMTLFFDRPQLMRAFIPSLFLHWWYIVVVGFLGNFKKSYQWKGRNVR